jgi:hypothetical protein
MKMSAYKRPRSATSSKGSGFMSASRVRGYKVPTGMAPNPCPTNNRQISVRYCSGDRVSLSTDPRTAAFHHYRLMSPNDIDTVANTPDVPQQPGYWNHHLQYFNDAVTTACYVTVHFHVRDTHPGSAVICGLQVVSSNGNVRPNLSVNRDDFLVQRHTTYKVIKTTEGQVVKMTRRVDPAKFFGITNSALTTSKQYHCGKTSPADSELFLRVACMYADDSETVHDMRYTIDITYKMTLSDPNQTED